MRHRLICKDCKTEIFADVNMVMLKDGLWGKVCDKYEDAICSECIEKRLGRRITEKDFKKPSVHGYKIMPCNEYWLIKNKTRI